MTQMDPTGFDGLTAGNRHCWVTGEGRCQRRPRPFKDEETDWFFDTMKTATFLAKWKQMGQVVRPWNTLAKELSCQWDAKSKSGVLILRLLSFERLSPEATHGLGRSGASGMRGKAKLKSCTVFNDIRYIHILSLRIYWLFGACFQSSQQPFFSLNAFPFALMSLSCCCHYLWWKSYSLKLLVFFNQKDRGKTRKSKNHPRNMQKQSRENQPKELGALRSWFLTWWLHGQAPKVFDFGTSCEAINLDSGWPPSSCLLLFLKMAMG